MYLRLGACVTTLSTCLFAGAPAFGVPDPTPDPNAAVVLLRSDCGPAGSQLENCFETMASLTGWIWTTRSPSASAPLLVDIGPGQFEGFSCDGGGHVTLRGSGREQSVLKGSTGVQVKNCDQLGFIDLGIHGDLYGVYWIGRGFSSWSDVDVFGTGDQTAYPVFGWLDDCDWTAPERSVHYFHGSRIRVAASADPLPTRAFQTACAETWFFGGEVLLDVPAASESAIAIYMYAIADFRAFGTAIRARAAGAVTSGLVVGVWNQSIEDPSSYPPPLNALPGGAFHSHGSIINTSVAPSAPAATSATALHASADSLSHTPGSAFVVKAGAAGTSTRIDSAPGARVHSPFLWQSGATPPQAPSETNTLVSADGQDIFVETDCATSGDCSAAGRARGPPGLPWAPAPDRGQSAPARRSRASVMVASEAA